jgi:hypothetical protein
MNVLGYIKKNKWMIKYLPITCLTFSVYYFSLNTISNFCGYNIKHFNKMYVLGGYSIFVLISNIE